MYIKELLTLSPYTYLHDFLFLCQTCAVCLSVCHLAKHYHSMTFALYYIFKSAKLLMKVVFSIYDPQKQTPFFCTCSFSTVHDAIYMCAFGGGISFL